MSIEESAESLKLRPDVVLTALEQGAVLLDLTTKYFYSVNSSGWALTQLFEGGISREKALEHSRAWGSNGSSDDVAIFIDKLVSESLIAPADDDVFETEVSFAGQWVSPTLEK